MDETENGLDSAEAVATSALSAEDQGDISAALRILLAGIEAFPKVSGLWNNLGVVYSKLGRWSDAAGSFEIAIERGYQSWVGLGLARESEGDLAGAEIAYRSGLATDPTNPNLLTNLGILLLQTDRLYEAEIALRGAADIDAKANWILADALIEQDDASGALAAINLAIAAGEDRAHLDRAHILLTMAGDPVPDLIAAIEASVPSARRDYSLYLRSVGELEEALRVALAGVANGDERSYLPAAMSADSLHRYREAVRYYRLAIGAGDDEYEEELATALDNLNRG